MKKSLKKAKKIKKLVPPPPDEGAMEIPDFLVRDKDNVPQTLTGKAREDYIKNRANRKFRRETPAPALKKQLPKKLKVARKIKKAKKPMSVPEFIDRLKADKPPLKKARKIKKSPHQMKKPLPPRKKVKLAKKVKR